MGQIQIIVEGMTASGKSTIVNLLSERLNFKIMPEEFRDSLDLLSRFHRDRKWGFPMQINFLAKRFAQYLCASEEDNYIMDRSMFGDKVYAKLYYELGYFSDSQFGSYLTLYDSFMRNIKAPKLLILVRCPFDEIMRRIKMRGRPDEIEAGADYWQALYNAYVPFMDFVKNEMPGKCEILELDLANPEFIRTPAMIEKFIGDVKKFFPDKN